MVLGLKDLKTYLLKQKSLVCYKACNPSNPPAQFYQTHPADPQLRHLT